MNETLPEQNAKPKHEHASGVITVVSCCIHEQEETNKKLNAKFLRSALGTIRQQGYVFFHMATRFDLAFTDPLVATNWCMDLLRYLHGGRAPKGLALSFGITMGVTNRQKDHRTNRQVFEGASVEWARRFAISANPNQLLSGDVLWASMRRYTYMGKLNVVGKHLGVHRFGGVEGARDVMELRPKGFEGYEFPPINTLGTNITNLPNDPGYFIGREPELSAVRRYFAEGQTLVSLVCAPGMGASRLAMRYGALQLGEYPGGVWACSLQDVSTAGGMLGRVAQVLRLPIQISGIAASNKVASALASRPAMMVILDGVDGLLDVCGLTLQVWKERAPNVHFLVTSHIRLGLPGESVLILEPMNLHDGFDLFMRHARDTGARLNATEEESRCIETIIKRVDGMPLGILLAAGWTDMMSVTQLEERLRSGLGLLSRPRPGSRKSRRTLNSSMSVAWENLSLEQRSLLGQCSIFKTPFSIEDVEAVVEMHRFPNPEAVVELLMGICERSLARSSHLDTGEVVFELYASAREFGRQHLASSGEQRAMQGRLTEHVLRTAGDLVGRIAKASLGSSYEELGQFVEALEDIRLSNVRPGDEGRAILCEEPFLIAKGEIDGLDDLLQHHAQFQTNQVPVRVQIELLRARADLAMLRGDIQRANADIAEALSDTSSTGRDLQWRLKLRHAVAAYLAGEKDVLEGLDTVVEGARLAEDRKTHAEALLWKARALFSQGSYEACYELTRLARSTATDVGLSIVSAEASLLLGALERSVGQAMKGLEDHGVAEQVFMLVSDDRLSAEAGLEQAYFELSSDNPQSALRVAIATRTFLLGRGMRRPLAKIFQVLGYGHHLLNELNEALDCYQEASRLFKDAGDNHSLGLSYLDIGRLLQEAGDAKAAEDYCERSLKQFEAGMGGRPLWIAQSVLATLLAEAGKVSEANRLFKTSSVHLNSPSDPMGGILCQLVEAQIQLASAWKMGSKAGPELRSKALSTYRLMQPTKGNSASSHSYPVEVLLSLRMLRRRVKQAGK